MSKLSQYFPSRNGVAKQAGVKQATGQADPGPDSSHPASIVPPIVPPSGETMSDATTITPELVGDMAVTGGTGGAVKDKKPETLETQTGTIATVPTEPINSTAPDFGADDHPAQSGAEKFASCKTVDDVLAVLQSEINAAVSKVAAAAAADEQAKAAAVAAPPQAAEPEDQTLKLATVADRISYLTSGKTPAETAQRQASACSKVAGFISPLVNLGVQLATDFQNFTKLAEVDPAAAEAMVSGDPAAMGGAAMPPMDPAAMGGGEMPPMDPAAGGGAGGATLEDLQAAIEQLAADEGVDPATLLQMLEQEISGQGGGEAMPPAAAADSEMPASGASVAGGESAAAPASDPAEAPSEGEKTAASPEIVRKFAQYLDQEIGLGINEVARLRQHQTA